MASRARRWRSGGPAQCAGGQPAGRKPIHQGVIDALGRQYDDGEIAIRRKLVELLDLVESALSQMCVERGGKRGTAADGDD